MTKWIKEAFAQFAAEATVTHRGEEKATRGFLQPITKESGEEPFTVGVLGAVDERCWRFLGAAEAEIVQGDGITFDGEKYRVLRSQAVYIGAAISHYETVVTKEAEE